MTLDELKLSINDKTFTDQDGETWRFMYGTTLRWGLDLTNDNAVSYEFIEEDSIIYLKHNSGFPTASDLIVDVFEEDPL